MTGLIRAAKHHARRAGAIRGAIGALAVALGISALPSPAFAQDALTQRGVPAEATAENAVIARERAIASAQRIAFDQMAQQMGITARPGNIDSLVDSLIVESERTSLNGYTGRLTVRFNARRVAALGGRPPGSEGTTPGSPPSDPATVPPPTPTGPIPASAYLDAGTNFRSLNEWVALRRRLLAQPSVASVDILAISVDGARLRIGLRSPPNLAAGELAQGGILLAPVAAAPLPPGVPRPSTPPPGWRVGLAGGA